MKVGIIKYSDVLINQPYYKPNPKISKLNPEELIKCIKKLGHSDTNKDHNPSVIVLLPIPKFNGIYGLDENSFNNFIIRNSKYTITIGDPYIDNKDFFIEVYETGEVLSTSDNKLYSLNGFFVFNPHELSVKDFIYVYTNTLYDNYSRFNNFMVKKISINKDI